MLKLRSLLSAFVFVGMLGFTIQAKAEDVCITPIGDATRLPPLQTGEIIKAIKDSASKMEGFGEISFLDDFTKKYYKLSKDKVVEEAYTSAVFTISVTSSIDLAKAVGSVLGSLRFSVDNARLKEELCFLVSFRSLDGAHIYQSSDRLQPADKVLYEQFLLTLQAVLYKNS